LGNWKEKKSKNRFRANRLKQLPNIFPPNVEELIISGEYYTRWEIEDYSALKPLKQLYTLHISFHRIQDISFIEHLSNLEILYLDGNLIEDIQALKNLKNLKSLSLYENLVADISHLKDLENLETIVMKFLNLSYLPIAFANLKTFAGKLGDYTHLPELPHIEKIWQLMQTQEEENINLAQQLAKGQGWTEEEFQMYKN